MTPYNLSTVSGTTPLCITITVKQCAGVLNCAYKYPINLHSVTLITHLLDRDLLWTVECCRRRKSVSCINWFKIMQMMRYQCTQCNTPAQFFQSKFLHLGTTLMQEACPCSRTVVNSCKVQRIASAQRYTQCLVVVILFVFAKLGHTCLIPLKTVRHQVCLKLISEHE